MGEFLLLKSTLSLIYCYYFQDDVAYIFFFKSIFLIFSLTSIQNNRLFGNFGCWSLNYEKKTVVNIIPISGELILLLQSRFPNYLQCPYMCRWDLDYNISQ